MICFAIFQAKTNNSIASWGTMQMIKHWAAIIYGTNFSVTHELFHV
jgi:hypothetical protein